MSCAGDCCVAFPIGGSTTTGLTTLANLWVNQGVEDGLDLLAMLVPLSTEEAIERRARFGVELPIDVGDPDDTYYRCVHWDEDTRLCRNYENRPAMCRNYPYGRGCEHGCDCADARPADHPQPDPAVTAPAAS